MSQTHDKPALSPEQQAAVKAIRDRSRSERPGPDELIDRGEIDELVPQAQYIELRSLMVRLRDARERMGLSLTDLSERTGLTLRGDQPTGKWLEPEPDSRDALPLHRSPRTELEIRRRRIRRTRKGRLILADAGFPLRTVQPLQTPYECSEIDERKPLGKDRF